MRRGATELKISFAFNRVCLTFTLSRHEAFREGEESRI